MQVTYLTNFCQQGKNKEVMVKGKKVNKSNKWHEVGEDHDHPRSERTWHIKEDILAHIQQIDFEKSAGWIIVILKGQTKLKAISRREYLAGPMPKHSYDFNIPTVQTLRHNSNFQNSLNGWPLTRK